MNATKNQITITVVAVLLIIAGIYAFSNSGDKVEKDSIMKKDDTMIKEEGAMMDKKRMGRWWKKKTER